MLIDCYGNKSTSVDYFKRKKQFTESVKSGAFTYIRFGTDDVGTIHCIDESIADNPKLLWAHGSWTARESLEYVTDLNTPLEIAAIG